MERVLSPVCSKGWPTSTSPANRASLVVTLPRRGKEATLCSTVPSEGQCQYTLLFQPVRAVPTLCIPIVSVFGYNRNHGNQDIRKP